MSRRTLFAVVAATATLVGCGVRVGTTPLADPYPPLAPDAEVLVWSVGVPDCPFEELGLTVGRAGLGASFPEVIEGMKEEARRIGGDALVGLQRAPQRGEQDPGLTATVVRFASVECRR